MAKGIYRFMWHCGRMGTLTGIFVSTPEDIAKRVGRELDFGEALGKHSEVVGEMSAEDVELVTEDPEAVAMFEKYKLETGHTPFNDNSEDEDEDDEDDEDEDDEEEDNP